MKDVRGTPVVIGDTVAVMRQNAGMFWLRVGEVVEVNEVDERAKVKTEATNVHRSFTTWTDQVAVLEKKT